MLFHRHHTQSLTLKGFPGLVVTMVNPSELESEIRRFSYRKETALYGLIPVFSSSR